VTVKLRRRLTVLALATGALVLVPATGASAHPLGNFTVNHFHGLQLYPDRIEDLAVVDSAEIPTLQEREALDRNGDRTLTATERRAYAAAQCGRVAAASRLIVNGRATAWTVAASTLEYRTGAAGLDTSRLTCRLRAATGLTRPATVGFTDGFRADRLGWREIAATGKGVHIEDSPVPERSVSNELRKYPNDLLAAPLDQRSVRLKTAPGDDPAGPTRTLELPAAGLVTRAIARLDATVEGLVGARHLTLPVGLLAVALSILLGAGHAALPGHGKTVMAAYIAGRRGSLRDAVTVGATVTLTHTGGVLLLGLLVTVSASLAAESLLSYLGIASGLLIATIGAGLLLSAWRGRHPGSGGQTPAGSHGHGHGHGHGHSHGHDHGHDHVPGFSRRGLIGMGVAGGLVPSPSALIVLLGAVALGRTGFGIALVLGYGLGMAATLTAAGLLLVRLRDRLARSARGTHRLSRLTAVARLVPAMTACLVLCVGLGLAARGLAPLV